MNIENITQLDGQSVQIADRHFDVIVNSDYFDTKIYVSFDETKAEYDGKDVEFYQALCEDIAEYFDETYNIELESLKNWVDNENGQTAFHFRLVGIKLTNEEKETEIQEFCKKLNVEISDADYDNILEECNYAFEIKRRIETIKTEQEYKTRAHLQ